MSTFFRGFMPKALSFSLSLAGLMVFLAGQQASRNPASNVQDYELHIQTLQTEVGSKLRNLSNVSLRATFDKNTVMDFGKNEHWSVAAGESRKMDLHIDLKPSWIRNDSIEFKLELVDNSLVEAVVLRCSTVVKNLSVYNRAYNCSVPGETNPVLAYRVAHKGAPIPNSAVASTETRR